jgi:predicted ATPase
MSARADLPDGTVTMVFTDIVGSTVLLRDLGDRYAGVLAAHRQRVRAIVERHDGSEVGTQGDAFFLVFRRASDAIGAAGEIAAESPGDEPIEVRIGVHTGDPTRHDDDYVGMDVHVAARIAAAGSGGQVLVSRQTRELIPHEALRDLGVHRLKDVGEIHLFQLGDHGFPPVRSIGGSNLASPHEAPLGRDGEMAELRALVTGDGVRLITLTGPGGIGKTTVARALASGLGDRFPDGTWFVDLASVTDSDLLEPAVGLVVGSQGAVADHLQSRTGLLILDNLEQVLDAAPVIAGWASACPGLVIVVTSRERLHVSAEREFPIEQLGDTDAALLFRRRARAVSPRFDADDEALQRVCRRLDGIPLAIELAAARVRLLTADQLLERLDRRFSVLTGGPRDAPTRQRTLEATIEWSYDLLDGPDKELFTRLSVFAGGWTLDAAETVVDGDLDGLESLAAKSLVRWADGRFSMFESLRAYAASRLDPDAADELRRRHAAYFAALAAEAAPGLTGRRQDAWLETLASEDDNIRAALDWCLRDPASHELGLELAGNLVLFWYLRSRPWEGWRWLEPLLRCTDPADSPSRTAALWGAGFFLTIITDSRARDSMEQALEMATRLGDASMAARSLDMLGLHAFFDDDLEGSLAYLEQSIAQARAAGDDWCLADALGTIGSIYPLVGRFREGRAASSEGVALARERDDLQGERMALFGLALTARRAGDAAEATASGEQGLEICRRLGDGFFSSYFLWVLASVARDAGELQRSRALADEALLIARELQVPVLLVCALEVRASVGRDEGDPTAARELLEEADRIGGDGSVPGSYRSEAVRLLGNLDADDGDSDGARRRFAEALELARAVSDPWAEARAAADLERLA